MQEQSLIIDHLIDQFNPVDGNGKAYSRTTNLKIPLENYEAAYEEDRKVVLINLQKYSNLDFFSCANGWNYNFAFNLSSKENLIIHSSH
jgi:hypothetical protein